MANRNESYQECLKLVEKLQSLRVLQVQLDNQIKSLEQKKTLHGLEWRRLDAQKVLEVALSKQSNGQPLVKDIEVKRAMVEDLLAQDKTAVDLLRKIRLIDRAIQRKSRKYGIQQAELDALESKEKILILQAT